MQAVPAAQPPDAGCPTLAWTQCGGKGYTGATCCPKGYSCTYRTSDYSQCAKDYFQ